MEPWIKLFETRAKCPFRVADNEKVMGNPEKGFLGYILDVHNMDVIITKMCGDGKYWYNKIIEFMTLAKPEGWLHCKFSTVRDPKAFKRFVGGEVINQTVENGQIVYYFDWTLETGKGAYDLGR